ncbi:MAG TPA: dephospho-CoA kinase [Microbacteriaceae bacterium]|nr:dephospho-CoA kinase [Microbacteriaceae bacterium]
MKMIALTGGIASGKSTIAKRLDELGAHVIDADNLARDAVKPGSKGLNEIIKEFGREILLENGELNRNSLAELVFADGVALSKLNSIVHPEVHKLFSKKVSEITQSNRNAVIVYDVPLLAEHDSKSEWDHVVVASAPEETRINRLVELRGFKVEEARARILNQADEKERIAIADTVIDTSKSMSETIKQTDAFWKSLVASNPKLGK